MRNQETTFLWHDYETWGTQPALDRPAQFAGIRTDNDFNQIGESINIYASPSNDFLPQPEACLVTGLSPQKVFDLGVNEAAFFQIIFDEMIKPGTCSLGYNSIQFDDEVTRYGLYRNFFDPYEREWRNGNSRWDIINLLRLAHAIRPEGILWPKNDEGYTSFRLEDLANENEIMHQSAHDALSDVRATILLAKKLKEAQPKLFDYVFNHRLKKDIVNLLDLKNFSPVLHASPYYSAKFGFISSIAPITYHPKNKNCIIAFDLRFDPNHILNLSIDDIKSILSEKDRSSMAEKKALGICTISLNKAPVIVPINVLSSSQREKWFLCEKKELDNLSLLKESREKIIEVSHALYSQDYFPTSDNCVDTALYEQFLTNKDKMICESIRATEPSNLSKLNLDFDANKLNELFFRYRARNYPDTLSESDKARWEKFRKDRLMSGSLEISINASEYRKKISRLIVDPTTSADEKCILDKLINWPSFIGL